MSNETQPAITKEVETEETSFKQVLPPVQITDDMLTDDEANCPGPMEGAVFGGTAALDAAVEASNAAGSPDDQVVEPNNVIEPEAMAEAPVPEPAPEREKVWNIHLQAWV